MIIATYMLFEQLFATLPIFDLTVIMLFFDIMSLRVG